MSHVYSKPVASESKTSSNDLQSQGLVPAIHINQGNSKLSVSNQPQTNTIKVVNNIYQTTRGNLYLEAPVEWIYHKRDAQGLDGERIMQNQKHNASDVDQDMPLSQQSASRGYIEAQLIKTKAKIDIQGPIARTTFKQVFKNQTPFEVSGRFLFPLPENANVDALTMRYGDRSIIGEIQPKQRAINMFNQAKLKGQKAALLEQVRPNMFVNSLANIPAYNTIEIEIEYQQLIKQEQNTYSFRLPLSITPRYHSKLSQAVDDDTNKIQDTVQYSPSNMDLSVTINTGLPLSSVRSEHHKINTRNIYDTVYQIDLDKSFESNKDFVLHWQMSPSHMIKASHISSSSEESRYGIINIMPPKQDTIKSKRILTLVLDNSGSMVGDSIEYAKQAVAMAIDDLNNDDYFNLIKFNDHASAVFSQNMPANESNKQTAMNALAHIQAEGGTEMYQAMDYVFEFQDTQKETHLHQIIFVTDGAISNEYALMKLITRSLGNSRLFTVGIGGAPNGFFMKEAALIGKGSYTFIGDTSQIKPLMKNLLNKIKSPALTNIRLKVSPESIADSIEYFPKPMPDLYANEPLHISYKIPNSSLPKNSKLLFTVEGEFLSPTASQQLRTRKFVQHLDDFKLAKETSIEKHWARQKLEHLRRQKYTLNLGKSLDKKSTSRIDEQALNVAMQYKLLSSYTSLVAIDYLMASSSKSKDNSSDKEASFAQAARVKKMHATLPQTATNFYEKLAYGICLLIMSGTAFIYLYRGEADSRKRIKQVASKL